MLPASALSAPPSVPRCPVIQFPKVAGRLIPDHREELDRVNLRAASELYGLPPPLARVPGGCRTNLRAISR